MLLYEWMNDVFTPFFIFKLYVFPHHHHHRLTLNPKWNKDVQEFWWFQISNKFQPTDLFDSSNEMFFSTWHHNREREREKKKPMNVVIFEILRRLCWCLFFIYFFFRTRFQNIWIEFIAKTKILYSGVISIQCSADNRRNKNIIRKFIFAIIYA